MLSLKRGSGLRGWEIAVFLKQLHDQVPPLLQYLPVAALVVAPAHSYVPGIGSFWRGTGIDIQKIIVGSVSFDVKIRPEESVACQLHARSVLRSD